MKELFIDQWKRYLETVYPEGVVEEQRKQLYLAFHAGALMMYSQMLDCVKAGGNEDVSQDRIRALFDEVKSNCEAVTDQITKRN